MKTSLRRGHAIRVILEAYVKDVSISSTADVSIFDIDANSESPSSVFDKAFREVLTRRETAMEDSVSQALWVVDVLGRLRKTIASANESAGLNGILTDIANIDAKVKILTDVYGRKSVDVDALVEGNNRDRRTLEDISRQRSKEGGQTHVSLRGLGTSVSVDVRAAAIQKRKEEQAELRRKRSELEDKRLSLNYSTTIEIPDEDMRRLTAIGIL